MEPLIEWNTHEHSYNRKTSDWYWAVGIIAVTAAILAFIFGNVLFGILILVASFALCLFAARVPHEIHCEINDRGIVIDNVMYPFVSLDSFWIAWDHGAYPKIILKSRKAVMPFIYVPIDEVDPEHVREILLNYIAETEHSEPLGHHIFTRLGF